MESGRIRVGEGRRMDRRVGMGGDRPERNDGMGSTTDRKGSTEPDGRHGDSGMESDLRTSDAVGDRSRVRAPAESRDRTEER